MNKVILMGNLGQDVDLKHTSGGQAVANFSLATSFKTKGEDKTEWHRIVVWGDQAETVSKFIGKGSKVLLEGRLQTRNYEDKEGNKRYTTEIVAERVTFLDRKGDKGDEREGNEPSMKDMFD